MFKFKNYLVNHGYFTQGFFNSFADALSAAKKTGFETAIYRSETKDGNNVDTIVAGYDAIGGLKFYDEATEEAWYVFESKEIWGREGHWTLDKHATDSQGNPMR